MGSLLSFDFKRQLKYLRTDGDEKKHSGARLPVLMHLILSANIRNRAWPSQETIIEDTGLTKPTVRAALTFLEDRGAIYNVPSEKRIGSERTPHGNSKVWQLTGLIRLNNHTVAYLHMSDEDRKSLDNEIMEFGSDTAKKLLCDEPESEPEIETVTLRWRKIGKMIYPKSVYQRRKIGKMIYPKFDEIGKMTFPKSRIRGEIGKMIFPIRYIKDSLSKPNREVLSPAGESPTDEKPEDWTLAYYRQHAADRGLDPAKNPLVEAVCMVYQIEAGGWAGTLLAQLTGTSKKGQRKEYACDFTRPSEIVAFGYWYMAKYKQSSPPTTAETLYERVQEFKAEIDTNLLQQAHNSAQRQLLKRLSLSGDTDNEPEEYVTDDAVYDALFAEMHAIAEAAEAADRKFEETA